MLDFMNFNLIFSLFYDYNFCILLYKNYNCFLQIFNILLNCLLIFLYWYVGFCSGNNYIPFLQSYFNKI